MRMIDSVGKRLELKFRRRAKVHSSGLARSVTVGLREPAGRDFGYQPELQFKALSAINNGIAALALLSDPLRKPARSKVTKR